MECPLCRSSEHVTLYYAYSRFDLFECDDCKLLFQRHAETTDVARIIEEVYDDRWVAMRDKYAHLTFQDHALFNTLQLEMFRPGKGRLLEIGSGTGEFLFTAQSAGWDVTGVEASASSCKYAKQKYDLELHNALWSPELAEEWEPFDAVVFWHVLEHMARPVEFLCGVAGKLQDNGLLLFSVPNLQSFTNAIYGKQSPLLTEKDHLYHYSARSLMKLLAQTPFQPVSLFTRQVPNHLEQLLGSSTAETAYSMADKMAILTQLQGKAMGHEICCIARKRPDSAPPTSEAATKTEGEPL
ncbi:class I SAM-dependent methyltransferase [Paenibacillus sp. FSL M8-0334]|uniref:class I SAM-dependent methyltransferase n=1 Tax=Paenibacillus sp. FSL M8-0334 TaxID=2921623 RepID=UPI0030FA5634